MKSMSPWFSNMFNGYISISIHIPIYLVPKSLENPQLNRMAQRHAQGFEGFKTRPKTASLCSPKEQHLWLTDLRSRDGSEPLLAFLGALMA